MQELPESLRACCTNTGSEIPKNTWIQGNGRQFLVRYYRCDIKGAENGLLKGKTVAIKDNVSVAGVPMMNGSKLLEGFVPDRDATVVTRILDAASDLGINSKKKKKDDLICDILSSQAPEVSLTPVVQSISAADGAGAGAVVQFKENMPPFNAVHYEPISHNTQLPKVSFTSVYEFMITRRRQGDQSIQNFKGLDKSVKHFDAGDVQDICLAQIDGSTVYIRAYCLASMKKQRYQVFLCITHAEGKNRVDFAYCQCPIGLAQACSHIGGLLFSISNVQSSAKALVQTDQSCTSSLCQWNVPRTMNQKPMPISTLNLSRPKVVASSETDVNVAMLSSPSHGSAMARFDPRHSEDRHHSLTWSLDQLRKLKASFPLTGMAHLWNIPDTGVPSVVENEVEVTTAVHPLHLKMEMMVFSDGNCGRITGKSVCEDMCFSGSSFTASSGPVRNPYDATRTTGGSSSGSASLLVRKKVDVAIGGDQGGSIRIPASWCGIVGLKPTYGLVPYTGIMPIEMTYDHVGPMARTVEDCATLLEDEEELCRSSTVSAVVKNRRFFKVNDGIKGKKIGLLTEGFIGVEEDLAGIVRQAALTLKEAGAEVSDVSLPIHSDGGY
uniref:Amidase n=1 Tax=Magallana gigas TaxID=29159 RepID=K1P6P1_MAGGI